MSYSNTTMAGIGTAFAAGTLGFLYLQRRKKGQTAVRRSMSFTSAYMAIGTYPEKAKYSEPIINAAMYFDEVPTQEEIVEQAVKPMLAYDRLARIPMRDKAGTMRLPSPPFDPQKMVRKMDVSCLEELYSKIQDIFNEMLGDNQARGDLPWWEFLILENKGAGPSVVIFRIHHALGDGVSLAALLSRHVLKAVDASDISNSSSFLPTRLMSRKSSLIEDLQLQCTWSQRVAQMLRDAHKFLTLPVTAFDDATVFSKASVRPDLVHNRKRKIIVFPTVPLMFIQAMKNAADVTVNDVIFAIISQAIHDYCQKHNCPVLKERGPKLQCRALLASALPRNVEDSKADELLKNQFFLLSAEMCVGFHDVIERLHKIHENMKRLKHSPLAYVGIQIQNRILKYFPLFVNRLGVFNTMIRHSMTVSNVPGPKQPVLFCGKQMTGVHMFFDNLCPQFGIISYAGQIYANLTVDPEGVVDAESLKEFYRQAMIKLAERLNVPLPEELK